MPKIDLDDVGTVVTDLSLTEISKVEIEVNSGLDRNIGDTNKGVEPK